MVDTLGIRWRKSRLPVLALLTFGSATSLLWGPSWVLWDASGISGFYPQEYHHCLHLPLYPLVGTAKNVSRHCHISPGGQNHSRGALPPHTNKHASIQFSKQALFTCVCQVPGWVMKDSGPASCLPHTPRA